MGMEWIVESLKTSQELEVDESNTNIRRRTEVSEPKGQFERSIYAVSHCESYTRVRTILMVGALPLERLRKGNPRIPTKAREAFQPVWPSQCG